MSRRCAGSLHLSRGGPRPNLQWGGQWVTRHAWTPELFETAARVLVAVRLAVLGNIGGRLSLTAVSLLFLNIFSLQNSCTITAALD